MQIAKNSVVTFHYTLSNIGGEELESSDQNQPALYLHGHNNIMPALETALEGKQAGDELSVTL
ncbi:FKBP-type peptidyl-prolyl cis-trans isomerase, partial [Aequoribacter sp.]|uniref:FKBP-type peptidyl-prolyl cis-trans isomerase n=1 Tax=Aequoribacter sp. TaxID=2847771 RepID=UPI003F6A29E3